MTYEEKQRREDDQRNEELIRGQKLSVDLEMQGISIAPLDLDRNDVATVGMEKDRDTMATAEDPVLEETSWAHAVNDSTMNRIAIHLRFGDISSVLDPRVYREIVDGLWREWEQESTASPSIRFVYYSPEDGTSQQIEKPSDLSKMQYPRQSTTTNYKDRGYDQVSYPIQVYCRLEGSLGYMAAYLCPKCYVVFVTPKENGNNIYETDYWKNYYFMDEWVPYFRYLYERSIVASDQV